MLNYRNQNGEGSALAVAWVLRGIVKLWHVSKG